MPSSHASHASLGSSEFSFSSGSVSSSRKWEEDVDAGGLRGFVAQTFQLFSFAGWDKKAPSPIISAATAVLEFLQLFALSFVAPLANAWGDADDGLRWVPVVLNLGEGRLSYDVHVFLFWVLFAYILAFAVVAHVSAQRLVSGDERWSTLLKWASRMLTVADIAFFWTLSVMLASLSCTTGGGLSRFPSEPLQCGTGLPLAHLIVGLLFVVFALVPLGIVNAIANFPALPQPGVFFSLADGRIRLVMFGWKCATLVAGELLQALIPAERWTAPLYGLLLVAAHVHVLALLVLRLPYHRSGANQTVAAAISVSLAAAATRSVMVCLGASSVLGAYVFPAVAILLAVMSSLACRLRFRRIMAKSEACPKVHPRKSVALMAGSDEIESTFDRDYEIEICARPAYVGDGSERAAVAAEKANEIFAHGNARFPESVAVKIAQAVYMLTAHEDLQLTRIVVARARRLGPSWLERFQLNRIDRIRAELTSLQDGGAQEIATRLARASRYQAECKRRIRAFWGHLAKDEDLSSLPEIVSAIDYNERRAEDTFRRLIVLFPKSPQVLRAYGSFLEEIKNDGELAQMAFRSADDLEEQWSHRHRATGRKAKNDPAVKPDRQQQPHAKRNSKRGSEKEIELAESDSVKGVRFQPAADPAKAGDAKSGNNDWAGTDSADEDAEYTGDVDADHADVADRGYAAKTADAHQVSAPVGAGLRSLQRQTSQTIDATRQRRGEALRQRKYRARIEHTKSAAIQRLSLSIGVTFGILLVDLLLMFISTKVIMDIISASIDNVNTASDVRYSVSLSAFEVRHFYKHARAGESIDAEEHRLSLTGRFTVFTEDVHFLYSNPTSGTLLEFWNDRSVNRTDFVPAAGNSSYSFVDAPTNLWDLSMLYSQSGFIVANMTESALATGGWSFVPLRLVLDNGLEVLFPAYDTCADLYAQYSMDMAQTLQTSLLIVFSVSIAGIALLWLVIFRPTLKRINAERMAAVRLFTAIPRVTLQEISDRLSSGDNDETPKDHEDEVAQDEAAILGGDRADVDLAGEGSVASMPMLKLLTVRYFCMLLVVLLFVATLFGLGLAFAAQSAKAGAQVNEAGLRQALIKRILVLSEGMLDDESSIYRQTREEMRASLIEVIDDLEDSQYALKYGSTERQVSPSITNAAQAELLYRRPCHLPMAGGKCNGLDMLLNRFLQDARLVSKLPDEALLKNNSLVQDLMAMVDEAISEYGNELEKFLIESTELYRADTSARIRSIDIALIVVFAGAMPTMCAALLVLRPVQKRIREENARTMRMLLMIPINVTDNVPAIREYLETGRQESAQERLRDALEESVARNAAIIAASVDGIVVLNASYKSIEVFNAAAQRMFGYTEAETLKKNVKMLMPETTAAAHDTYIDTYLTTREAHILNRSREVQALKKDGTLFPVALSVVEGHVNGQTFFVGYLRDQTEIRNYESMLVQEKERSEQLLNALLPKTVAEQLKQHSMRSVQESRTLIAEGYKEVTVLFADLVGFTKVSSSLTPSELVFTLNQLFSVWDELAERHQIEKIKTIGDSYMAAAGVPERCLDHATRMMEFAIDMLDALDEFNQRFDKCLQIRIGINVGPVVAGVLGVKKFAYDLWGDAVNVASRMESSGVPGRIQVSHAAFEALKSDFLFEERGKLEIKGKGPMLTYLFKHRKFSRTESGRVVERPSLTPPVDATWSLGLTQSRRPSKTVTTEPAAQGAKPSVVEPSGLRVSSGATRQGTDPLVDALLSADDSFGGESAATRASALLPPQ